MNEPMQGTIDGAEVPYRSTLLSSPSSKFIVDLTVEAEGDVPDLRMFEATGLEESGVTSANELVSFWKGEYSSPSDLINEWCVGLTYTIRVSVYDPDTGNTTGASWTHYG